MKKFKTHNQQLKILRNKGLTVPTDGRPKRILEKENYYNLINGYKDLFLATRKDPAQGTFEQYKTNTKFSELHALYKFDIELKAIFLKRVLRAENYIKNEIAYVFSDKYGSDNYMKSSNFDTSRNIQPVLNLIKDLQGDIASKVDKNETISHYMLTYGYVPLWVLVGILTFGRVSVFYQNMKQTDRRAISVTKYNVSDSELLKMIKMLTLLRNICAHDDRLYKFRPKSTISRTSYHRSLSSSWGRRNYGENDLFAYLIILRILLGKREISKMISEIKIALKELSKGLLVITVDDVLNEMGFPPNWEQLKTL